MKLTLKKLISEVLPLRNSIVFESNPEFGCNTLPVYDELVKRGIRNRYQYGRYTDFVKETYISTLDSFEQFIINLKMDRDPFSAERKIAMNRYCQYTDFKSTQRVCDFIEKKLIES